MQDEDVEGDDDDEETADKSGPATSEKKNGKAVPKAAKRAKADAEEA